ncbi:MAG: L,D-transpeptidase [Methylobacterium mesophilicum]|nr:L,D-transpeptidase [Methylobacterium mesophilicum]
MSSSSFFNAPTSRRRFLSLTALAGSAALAGCSTIGRVPVYSDAAPELAPEAAPDSNYALMYGPVNDNGFAIPAIPYQRIDPKFLRQIVPDPTGEQPGTIVVDTRQHFLYLVREGGMAMRYGVGLGRAGFAWSGEGVIQWKQVWPKWTPPAEMIARQPELAKYGVENGGQPGGLLNPLGARALYIFQNGQDTLYRLHGSPEWSSIGKNVSSGCVRLMNQDIIDLYDRVPTKSRLIVI